jgi:uncharacterized protein (DUF2062 family)
LVSEKTAKLSEVVSAEWRSRPWKGQWVIQRFKVQTRAFLHTLLKEGLDPWHAAAAVFLGIFIGIVPIYGLHTIAAVSLALLFRLNKPLTLACTFISNPVFQPVIVLSSVELGIFLRSGSFQRLSLSDVAVSPTHLTKEQILIWMIGSVALATLAGIVGGAITAVVVHLHLKASAQ